MNVFFLYIIIIILISQFPREKFNIKLKMCIFNFILVKFFTQVGLTNTKKKKKNSL